MSTAINLDRGDWSDLTADAILAQETETELPRFTVDDAHWLGERIVSLAGQKESDITVAVRHGHRSVFLRAGSATVLDNEGWVRRKSNVVELLDMSSLRANRVWAGDEVAFLANKAVDPAQYAIHGGAVPVRVSGVGLVGVATCSGLVSEADHTLVVQALADLREHLS
ncbi:heme-binding protein [Actinomyces polynesiensis]|uniref:heme-binding protein n=1 Tax=Actinomyces polynesiensis TaxID=1325934 RepID=UPI0005BD753B|nr:heme-binding protein [Actinomyces polynesiensis]